jgi:hypothetical protein
LACGELDEYSMRWMGAWCQRRRCVRMVRERHRTFSTAVRRSGVAATRAGGGRPSMARTLGFACSDTRMARISMAAQGPNAGVRCGAVRPCLQMDVEALAEQLAHCIDAPLQSPRLHLERRSAHLHGLARALAVAHRPHEVPEGRPLPRALAPRAVLAALGRQVRHERHQFVLVHPRRHRTDLAPSVSPIPWPAPPQQHAQRGTRTRTSPPPPGWWSSSSWSASVRTISSKRATPSPAARRRSVASAAKCLRSCLSTLWTVRPQEVSRGEARRRVGWGTGCEAAGYVPGAGFGDDAIAHHGRQETPRVHRRRRHLGCVRAAEHLLGKRKCGGRRGRLGARQGTAHRDGHHALARASEQGSKRASERERENVCVRVYVYVCACVCVCVCVCMCVSGG